MVGIVNVVVVVGEVVVVMVVVVVGVVVVGEVVVTGVGSDGSAVISAVDVTMPRTGSLVYVK